MVEDRSQNVSRRSFLGFMAGALTFVGIALSSVPFVSVLFASVQAGRTKEFVTVGPVGTLAIGVPTSLTFADVEQDAYIRQSLVRSVWAVKNTSGDVVVYTPTCPHLGCQYSWDSTKARFVCPCHTSIWTIDGKLISGPSPRNLDTLPSKVENGVLLVQWERYKLAIPQKITVA